LAHNGTFKPRVCQQTVNTFGNAPDSTEKAAPPATPPPTRPRATDAPERTTAPRRRRRRRGHLHELVGAPSDARAAPAASHAPTLPAIVRGTPPHFARRWRAPAPFGLRPLGAGGEPRARPPSKTDVVGGWPPGSPLPGWGSRGCGHPLTRVLRSGDPLPPRFARCLGAALSRPRRRNGRPSRAGGLRAVPSRGGGQGDADSPSHRRRSRRLLRLDMRTLAHVCAPRLTWSASERPRSPRGPERAALRL
jgi:hypothetical protein